MALTVIYLCLLFNFYGGYGCMYESNGQQIDLSCFGDIVFNTDDQAERHNYSYTPCRNGVKCLGEEVMVEQTLLETGNCTEGGVIARWDPEVNGTYNTEGNYWEIKYTNGDICDLNDEPRELILSFTCEPGVEHAIEPVTEQTNCVYEMTIATKYACPGNTEICSDSGNGDDGDSGLSGGWVFIILLIAAFMLYCVIGYVITGLRNKEGNMSDICDNIPNKEFWTKLPSLVCAGCGFTKDFCIALCCRMRGDTDDDFEDIDDKQQNMLTEEDKEL